jgi:regulatory protein
MEVSKKKAKKRAKLNEKLSAFDYAVYLLSSRLLSVGQLSEKLGKKGYAEDDVDKAISRLTDLRYLNDEQFAQIYFENLKKYKLFGYFGIKKKLLEKKLGSKIIDALLASFSAAEELQIAKKAVAKKKGKNSSQIVRFLQSKGFRSAAIFGVAQVNIGE